MCDTCINKINKYNILPSISKSFEYYLLFKYVRYSYCHYNKYRRENKRVDRLRKVIIYYTLPKS